LQTLNFLLLETQIRLMLPPCYIAMFVGTCKSPRYMFVAIPSGWYINITTIKASSWTYLLVETMYRCWLVWRDAWTELTVLNTTGLYTLAEGCHFNWHFLLWSYWTIVCEL